MEKKTFQTLKHYYHLQQRMVAHSFLNQKTNSAWTTIGSVWQGESYQWTHDDDILIPVGPWQQLTKFLTDTGTQISIVTQQDAEKLGIRPRQQWVKITGVNGASAICQTAKVNLWFPGKKRMSSTRFAVKDQNENILGFDGLSRRTWHLPDSSVWSFSSNINPNPNENWEATDNSGTKHRITTRWIYPVPPLNWDKYNPSSADKILGQSIHKTLGTMH